MTKTYLTTAIIEKTLRDPNSPPKYWNTEQKDIFTNKDLKRHPIPKLQNKKMKITVLLLLSDT